VWGIRPELPLGVGIVVEDGYGDRDKNYMR